MQLSPFRHRLPLPRNPVATDLVCYEVQLPNEPRILEAFEGAVNMLSNWTYWGLDEQHTALIASGVFKQLYQRLEAQKCSVPPFIGADEGGGELYRQNPTNPCLLEVSADGVNWCPWADLSKCIPAGSQPGSGSQQPTPGGGQACYHASIEGSNKWLLPYQVNAGDTIAITNVHGAATDGTVSWFCPNGQAYFLGSCSGSTSTAGGDPLPAKPHMELIAEIAGTFYEAYNATITVPGGVSNANVVFQLNDSVLSDNYGNITFDVCVTNNGATIWTHTFDFTMSDGGFVSDAGTGGATYIPGTGWQSNNAGTNSMGFKRTSLAAYTLTSAELHVLLDTPQVGANLYVDDGVAGLPSTPYSGTGAHTYLTSGSVTITNGVLRFGADGTADSLGRHQIYQKVVLQGTGPNPF